MAEVNVNIQTQVVHLHVRMSQAGPQGEPGEPGDAAVAAGSQKWVQYAGVGGLFDASADLQFDEVTKTFSVGQSANGAQADFSPEDITLAGNSPGIVMYGVSPSIAQLKFNGTLAVPLGVNVDETIFTFQALGYDGVLESPVFVAAIDIKAAEDFEGVGNGSYMSFSTTGIGESFYTERVRIHSNGRLEAMQELKIAALSGVLKASAGLVSGGATTDDMPEGATNKYFNESLAIAYAVAL